MARQREVRFVVVTPERQVLEDTTASLVIPAHDGEIGILVDHAPLMCELGAGHLRYQKAGQTRRMFIDGGFAQVSANQVIVLTPAAYTSEEVTAEVLAEAERAAKAGATEGQTRRLRRVRKLRELQEAR